jgi:hypothetical protein
MVEIRGVLILGRNYRMRVLLGDSWEVEAGVEGAALKSMEKLRSTNFRKYEL